MNGNTPHSLAASMLGSKWPPFSRNVQSKLPLARSRRSLRGPRARLAKRLGQTMLSAVLWWSCLAPACCGDKEGISLLPARVSRRLSYTRSVRAQETASIGGGRPCPPGAWQGVQGFST